MCVCNLFDLLLIGCRKARASSSTTGAVVYIVRSDAVANRDFTPDLTAAHCGHRGYSRQNYLNLPFRFVIMAVRLVLAGVLW